MSKEEKCNEDLTSIKIDKRKIETLTIIYLTSITDKTVCLLKYDQDENLLK